jgi:hypothetical protein
VWSAKWLKAERAFRQVFSAKPLTMQAGHHLRVGYRVGIPAFGWFKSVPNLSPKDALRSLP